MSRIPTPAFQSAPEVDAPTETRFQALKGTRPFEFAIGARSREAAYQRLRTAFVTAGILMSFPLAAWAQSPPPAHDGPCRVAIINGQHVQPSPKCHLPPRVAQNPASIENTAPAQRQELDDLGVYLLRQGATIAGRNGKP
jgi:hypothetical protein